MGRPRNCYAQLQAEKPRVGRPHGRVVKCTCSVSAAQGFNSSDPRLRHGTTHQTMLRWHPTRHNQKDLQLEYTAMNWGALGRRTRERSEDWQQMLPQVSIFKKKKRKAKRNESGKSLNTLVSLSHSSLPSSPEGKSEYHVIFH